MKREPAPEGPSAQGPPGRLEGAAPGHPDGTAPGPPEGAAPGPPEATASEPLKRGAPGRPDRAAPERLDEAPPGRLDPAQWALVHDQREARHFAFWRGVELATEVCAERVRPGELWLDVGCGPGHLGAALAGLGAYAVGLDLDPRMARYGRRRWRQPFAVAAAFLLPFADRSCAGIVAVSLLGCLPLPAAFFVAAERVLAPGGTLCFSAMNRHSLLLAAGGAVARLGRRGPPRYTSHDPAALAAALGRAGFTPERQIFYGHFLATSRGTVPGPDAARRLERTAPPGRRGAWARQILLVARRGNSAGGG